MRVSLVLSIWFAPVVLAVQTSVGSPTGVTGPSTAASSPASADGLVRLRADCERSLLEGLSSEQLVVLSDRIRRVVADAKDPADRLSLLKLAGRLCWEGPVEQAELLREFALRDLVRLAPASARARVMLTEQFLPPLQRSDVQRQGADVAKFDALADRLASDTTDSATRRDLLFAKCRLRIETHRALNAAWLDAAERERVDRWLAELEQSDEPAPDGAAYREVAAGIRRELRETPFGRNIGEIAATDLDGKTKTIADFRGKVVILTFWSSWCLPCLEMVPHEAELLRKLQDRGVVLVGVNSDATTEQGRKTAASKGMTWPQLWSPPESSDGLVARLCVQQWPSLVVLDRDGAIHAKFVGSVFQGRWTMADVERAVLDLLAKP